MHTHGNTQVYSPTVEPMYHVTTSYIGSTVGE